jgi:hypothetical protein
VGRGKVWACVSGEDLRGLRWGSKEQMHSRWAELVKELKKDLGRIQSPIATAIGDV